MTLNLSNSSDTQAVSIANPIVDYLDIDNNALANIKKLLENRQGDSCEGIRISIRSRGCSGLSYTIEYAIKDKITKFDDLIIKDGIRIFIDPKASMFLIGSKMIYQENEISSGFDFVNPNEKGRCGCGESFKV